MKQKIITVLTYNGFSCFLKIIIGLQLIIPEVDTYASGKGFTLLSSIISEPLLAMVFIIAGVQQMLVFTVAEIGKDSTLLLLMRFISFMLFLAFSTALFVSNPTGLGATLFAAIALFEGLRMIFVGGIRENRMLN